MRTVLFYLVLVPSTLFFSLVSVVGGLLGAPKGLHDRVHRSWARCLLAAAGVRVRVRGAEHLPPHGGSILASNHQSLFDIWALMASLPLSLRFVAKAELSRIPLLARAMREAGHVFVDRDDPPVALAAMKAAGERMRREDLVLVIFPEGTRSPDGRLRRFKRGPFLLAIETGAPVVPVAVDGGHRVLAKGSRRVRGRPMDVRVGEPVRTGDLPAGERSRLARRVHGQVEAMLAGLQEERAPRS